MLNLQCFLVSFKISKRTRRASSSGSFDLLGFCRMLFFFVVLIVTRSSYGNNVSLSLQNLGDTTHLEFSGRSSWKYTLKKQGDSYLLLVPPLEDASIVSLKNWQNPHFKIESISEGLDSQTEIKFLIVDSRVTAFDYLTDQPSRLVLDFFKEDPRERKDAAETAPTQLPEKKQANNIKSKKKTRVPASSEILIVEQDKEESRNSNQSGVFDANDPNFSRFEVKDHEIQQKAEIASRLNIYLAYPPLELEQKALKSLWTNPPEYEIREDETEENQQARLLVTLFKKDRPAVFLKTLKLFREQFPITKFDEILRYMEADLNYDAWRKTQNPSDFELAITQYRKLVEDYPNSPLAHRTRLLVGYSYLPKGQFLGVIQNLDRFVKDNPSLESVGQASLTIGQAFLQLRKYDDAREIFKRVEMQSKNSGDSLEAAYRMGDTYFWSKDYSSAVAEYKKAIAEKPEGAKIFPNASFNLAESLFWTKDYRKALSEHINFLKKFPTHPHGGYSLTRIGEILEILGVNEKKVSGAFLECQFRYPNSPGSQIAKIRLMSQRIPILKDKEIAKAEKEIVEFAKGSSLEKVNEFITILMADGYFQRKDFQKSYDLLTQFYRDNSTSINHQLFRARIIKTVVQKVKDKSELGNFVDAFRVFGSYASTWLKGADRIDLPYTLGKSFEDAGVPEEAEKYYQKSLNKWLSVKGTQEGLERVVFENPPAEEIMNLRLASVSLKQGKYKQANDYLGQVNENFLEEKDKVERAIISSAINEAQQNLPATVVSLKKLVETWRGQPKELAPVLVRLAETYEKSNQDDLALKAIDQFEITAQDSSEKNDDVRFRAFELKAKILTTKDKNAALDQYQKIVDEFSAKRNVSSILYRKGLLHFESGDLKEAEKTWAELNSPQSEFWYKLGQEKLQQNNFEGDYKKYINRIPAMSGFKEGAKK